VKLRLATLNDVPALTALIEQSVRVLQASTYTTAQMDGALGTLLGVDRQLILDGTYFVVEVGQRLAACGGWSKRAALFGSDAVTHTQPQLLDPAVDAARIRAFFVHPDFCRQGIGTELLRASEQAARAAGFKRCEMGATLAGVPLYLKHGYVIEERIQVPLPNGERLPIVRMSRPL
jgi:GNAT superfamily N-acetyltransferase